MTDINIWTIVLIAFFTGLGGGIGNPIGQHIYEKYVKSKLIKTSDNVDNIKEKIKSEVVRVADNTINIEEKILGNKL